VVFAEALAQRQRGVPPGEIQHFFHKGIKAPGKTHGRYDAIAMNLPENAAASPPPDTHSATHPAAAQTASPTVVLTRHLAVGSLLGLIVLGLAWELWLAPLRPGGSWLALKVLPLCIPLAGLLKNRMYTYRWVSLLVWIYFTEGVVRAWSDKAPGNWLGLLEVLLCLMLFAACAMHVRLRLRNAKLQAATDGPANP